jgi:hypothetical protein
VCIEQADCDIHLAPGVSASYRVLSAAGGVTGEFASVRHNLDGSQYLVWAAVGSDFVDLHASAVPEPAALWLMAGGVVLLLARRRGTHAR